EPGSVLFVLGKLADGSIGFKQAKLVNNDGITARTLAWTANGTPHILAVGQSGTVRDYAGWPLEQQRSFVVTANPVAAAVGDIDADGTADLVIATQNSVSAYALDSGLQKWNEPLAGHYDLALAQLDADAALEIVLAGSAPGIVLDGATLATDWQYAGGFGGRLATGHLDPAGGIQWVGTTTQQLLSIFDADPWGPLGSIPTATYIHAIATAKVDESGHDAILAANDQWGSVHVYDPVTLLELFSVPNGAWGINAVAGADIDGDGHAEIVFAATTATQTEPLITVGDSQGGFLKWRFYPASNPFLTTALGDINGDGSTELVAAAPGVFGSEGTIEIFDAATGLSEWRSPPTPLAGNAPINVSAASIHLLPRPGSPGMDIILAGTQNDDGRIFVVDGVSLQTTLQIGQYATGPLKSRQIVGLSLFDYDDDGIDDFVVASSPTNSAPPLALIQIFSRIDGALLWSTSSFGAGAGAISDVLVVPGAVAGEMDMVAVMSNGLRAVNLQNGLLDWILAATNSGALYLPNGVNGPEFAVFLNEGALTFYDATSRVYLRSFALPAPVSALLSIGGDVHQLVAAAGNKLAYLDGVSGVTRAETDNLGAFADRGTQLSVSQQDAHSVILASASRAALYRHSLDIDHIFSAAFE
ncbi:MAG: VCBS repeat-containing protein, partial [Gammaproteobacteria bacterium]|nr:VCBS repeat-containing protein [Gammaproteobacteria bacterium]